MPREGSRGTCSEGTQERAPQKGSGPTGAQQPRCWARSRCRGGARCQLPVAITELTAGAAKASLH